jgi:hypothetical protein
LRKTREITHGIVQITDAAADINAGIGILIAKVVVKARIIKSAAAATETICAKIVAIKTVVAIETWIKCWIESVMKAMSECRIKALIN